MSLSEITGHENDFTTPLQTYFAGQQNSRTLQRLGRA